ncbi:MAG: acyl carrier protein [Acidimicrobiia bacterium]
MRLSEAQRLLRDLLAAHTGLDPEAIDLDMRLVEDLGLDSVDAVELLTSTERQTGLLFEVEQLEDIQTVGDVVDRLMEVSITDPD